MTYRRHPDVLWRRVGDEIVLLAPSHAEPQRLAGVGAAVWGALDEPMDDDQLAQHLSDIGAVEVGNGAGIAASRRSQMIAVLVLSGLVEQIDDQ